MNSRISIHATVLSVGLLSCSGAWAQERAVEAMHFDVGLTSTGSDTADSTSNGTLGAHLIGTFPLGRYLGAQLGGGYSESTLRTRSVLEDDTGELPGGRPSCNFDSYGGDASLFFRLPSFGRIGVAYGLGKISPECDGNAVSPASGTDELSTDSQRIDAEFYLTDFTFGASYTTTKLEDGPELESTALVGSWYPLDSLKVSLSGYDLYDENTYGVLLEHQPEMLGNVFGVTLGFSMTDGSPETTSFQIGLSYYFGRVVSLKVRDRQYR